MAVSSYYSSVCVHCTCGERYRKLYITFMFIATFCVTAVVGSLFTFGNIQPYLVSYIRAKSTPSSLRYFESTYLYSTQYAFLAVGIATGALIEIKIRPRMCVIIGGTLMTVGVYLSYFTIQYSYWLLFITYGVMFAEAGGIAYFASIACAIKWLPSKWLGAAVSVSLFGVGLGGLIFGAIQTAFININDDFPNEAPYDTNPDEQYFTQEELIDKVPFVFLIEGTIVFFITVFASFFMALPKATHDNEELDRQAKFSLSDASEVLLKVEFYGQWMACLIYILVFGVISSLYKTYGLEILKSSDSFLTALGGIATGVSSTIGRVSIGFIADKTGHKLAYASQSVIMAILCLTLPITSLGYPVMYFIWINGIFYCGGSFGSLVVISVVKGFGEKQFNMNYTLVVTTSQVIASFLYGVVSDYSVDSLGWLWSFVLMGGLCTVQALLVTLFFSESTDIHRHKRYKLDYLSALHLKNDHK